MVNVFGHASRLHLTPRETAESYTRFVGDVLSPSLGDRAWRDEIDALRQRLADLQRSHEQLRASEENYRTLFMSVAQGRDANDALVHEIDVRTRAEDALRASEERFRALFESMDEGYVLVDVIFDERDVPIDLRYVEANPAAIRMTGVELAGRRAREINPNFESHWFETFGRVAKTGVGERREFSAEPLHAWYDFYAFKVGGATSHRVAAVYQDVTARKHAEATTRESAARQAFLLALSDVLRPLNDPVAIQNAASRLLADHLHASRARYAECSVEDDDSPTRAALYQLDDPQPLANMLCTGRALVIPDMATADELPAALREGHVASGIRAQITVPLLQQGGLVAALTVSQASPRNWTALDVSLVQETAERTWAAVERARAEAALRESEAKYRSLFETIDEAFALCELVRASDGRAVDYRILEVNPAFERQIGRLRSNLLGHTARDAWPEARDWRLATYETVVERGEPTRFEYHFEAVDQWYDVSAFPRGGDRFAVLLDNITVRKRAEMSLRASEARQAYLVRLGDRLRPLADPVEIQAVAIRILGGHLGVSRAMYGEVDSDGNTVDIHADYCVPGVASIVGRHRLDAFGAFVEQHMRAGRTLVIADIDALQRVTPSERTTYAALGIGASLSVPLVKAGRIAAFLSVHQATPRCWTPADVALTEATAERTWAAVERARAEAALRQAHDELEARVQARTRELSAVMKQIVNVQEQERRRIARDLHDDIGQKMTALHLQLASLAHESPDENWKRMLRSTREYALQIDRDLRFFAGDLRSAALYTLGLVPALEDLAASFRNTHGIDVDLATFVTEGKRFSSELEVNLYRIAQEALHNAQKHAHADHIGIFLQTRDGRVVLIISDDGIGFDPEMVRSSSGGMGLASMRERAAMINAQLEIESSSAQGTSIIVSAPAVSEEVSARSPLDGS